MTVPQVVLGPRLALIAGIVTWFGWGLAIGYALGGGDNIWVYIPLLAVGWVISIFTTAINDLTMCVFWMEEFIRNERRKSQ